MIWLVSALGYAAVALVASRMFAGHLAWHYARTGADTEGALCQACWARRAIAAPVPPSPDGAQWFGAWCLGLAAALIWPIIGLLLCFPSDRWSVGEERRQVQRRQRERIDNLERELGLLR